MIEQQFRNEFEQLGKRRIIRNIDAALYNGDKQKQAYEWLEEQENGPERAHNAKVFRVQLINTGMSVLALIISLIALLKK
jgi:hypothetical protein